MAKRRRTTVPSSVREFARNKGVSIREALRMYSQVQQARAISSETDMQSFALGVSSQIQSFKLNK
jgi:hypothetical protein